MKMGSNRSKIAQWLAAGAFLLLLTGCGGGSDQGSGGNAASPEASPEQEVVIRATNWAFDQEEYHIPKDTPVMLTLVNDQGAHGIKIDGVKTELRPGKESAVVQLQEGTYTIRCSILCGTGHNQMVAKLVVS
mgnify:CR=1 FL=1|jgi:cytochrome c oxidase subunit 2